VGVATEGVSYFPVTNLHRFISSALAIRTPLPSSPMPRIVCFDLGGVVVRICRSWQEACAAAGLPYHEDIRDDQLRALRREKNTLLQLGKLTPESYFEEIAATTRGRYTPGQIERLHAAWILDEYPGIGPLIDRLNALDGLRTAILSNTDHYHWSIQMMTLPKFPTPRRISHPHASHLLGLRKPHAEIYRAFERAVPARPTEILFFDDTQENIDAARAAGWTAELIDHTGDTVRQMEQHLRTHGVL